MNEIYIVGTSPTIIASPNTRYVCETVNTLNFTPCQSGICSVRFTAGSNVTLTLPETLKMPEWWAGVVTNAVHEITVTDGTYAEVNVWTEGGNGAGNILYNKAQTLTDAQAAQARENIGAVGINENSPDWLYEMIFGDTSDWTADPTGTSYAGASCTKHGRQFDFAGMGSTAGSTVIWYNLTGTTHRAFNGSVNTTPASFAQTYSTVIDSDYINIPVKLSNVAGNANRYEVVGCDLLAKFTQTSTSEAANQIRLVFAFRRLNTETGEYEYSPSHYLGTSADYRYGGAVRGYVATTKLYDQTGYNAYWTEYEQVAIYLVRYSQRIIGSVILTPVMERFPADEGAWTAYADTPVHYWGADGSSTLSSRTLQRVNGHDYTLSGTASGSLYYKLDGKIDVISTTGGASAWEGTIDLEEGARYSLTVIPLSGSFTGTEGFYVALRTPDNTNLCTVNMLSGKQRSASFVWNDSTEKGKLILRVQQNIVTDTSFTFRVLITKHISEDGCVDVSGTTPSIIAVPGAAYNCVGTGSYVSPVAVTELSFVPSERGVCSVRFVSGTNATVLIIPNTVKMPDWWTGTEANRTYEISISDGVYGVVTSWTT